MRIRLLQLPHLKMATNVISFQDDTLVLNEAELSKILLDASVIDLPVVVICVAGNRATLQK
jgi:hypothetical protein